MEMWEVAELSCLPCCVWEVSKLCAVCKRRANSVSWENSVLYVRGGHIHGNQLCLISKPWFQNNWILISVCYMVEGCRRELAGCLWGQSPLSVISSSFGAHAAVPPCAHGISSPHVYKSTTLAPLQEETSWLLLTVPHLQLEPSSLYPDQGIDPSLTFPSRYLSIQYISICKLSGCIQSAFLVMHKKSPQWMMTAKSCV